MQFLMLHLRFDDEEEDLSFEDTYFIASSKTNILIAADATVASTIAFQYFGWQKIRWLPATVKEDDFEDLVRASSNITMHSIRAEGPFEHFTFTRQPAEASGFQ